MEQYRVSLKAARVNAEMSQYEAAKQIGVDAATISNWENNKTSPTVEQTLKACEVYRVPMSCLKFLK